MHRKKFNKAEVHIDEKLLKYYSTHFKSQTYRIFYRTVNREIDYLTVVSSPQFGLSNQYNERQRSNGLLLVVVLTVNVYILVHLSM